MIEFRKRLRRASLSMISFALIASVVAVVPRAAYAAEGLTSSTSQEAERFVREFDSDLNGTNAGLSFGIALSSSSEVYVTNAGSQRVQVFSPDGAFLRNWGSAGTGDGEFMTPYGIAVSSSNEVYVTDAQTQRVQVFKSDGTFLRSWGSEGLGLGEFGSPTGIAVSVSGEVYVVDSANNRIQVFKSDGTFLRSWGSAGAGLGELGFPTGIAINTANEVYVADTSNDRIQLFKSDGTFLHSWGITGVSPGEFTFPRDVAVSQSGEVFVADSENSRVQVFRPDGTFSRILDSPELFGSVAVSVSPSNEIYVTDFRSRAMVFQRNQNIGTVAAEAASGSIGVKLTEVSHITKITSLEAPTEQGYSYPLGLVDFTFETALGSTVPVTLTFETNLEPTQVSLRKYSSTTKSYAAISGVQITRIIKDDKSALQAVYSITDGGVLDADGEANGVIVDPVGLAVVVDAKSSPVVGDGVPGVPNTGTAKQHIFGVLTTTFAGVVALVLFAGSIRHTAKSN